MREYRVEDHAWRLWRARGGNAAELPPAFVNALEIAARDHMAMQAAIQPYIDAAISKTVNVPEDYPFEDFESLYLEAWHAGLKGITTYRPNSVLGAVLSVERDAPQDLDQSEPDRRIRISDAPQVALAALRWPHRPKLAAGSPSWTYMVEAPGNRFAVFVGHVENGERHPFEVWVNGEQTPRGLAALAKNLSMDMRAQDRAWLKLKLDSLAKTPGAPFTAADAARRPPGPGRRQRLAPSPGRRVPLRGARRLRRRRGRDPARRRDVLAQGAEVRRRRHPLLDRRHPEPGDRRRLRDVRQGMRAARRHQAAVQRMAVRRLPDGVQRPDEVARASTCG